MRDAQLIDQPVFDPGKCFNCGTNEGPVIDTMIDIVGDGRIYICTRTCLPQWARIAGYLSPEAADDAATRLADAQEQITALTAEVEFERDHKIVSVTDMVKLVEERTATTGNNSTAVTLTK